MNSIGKVVLGIAAVFVAIAFLGSFVSTPTDADLVTMQIKKDCREFRARMQGNYSGSMPAEMNAACKKLGF